MAGNKEMVQWCRVLRLVANTLDDPGVKVAPVKFIEFTEEAFDRLRDRHKHAWARFTVARAGRRRNPAGERRMEPVECWSKTYVGSQNCGHCV
jgi:hypothetical protein